MKSKIRNKPCECGSGKKYKKCCLNNDINHMKSVEKNTNHKIVSEVPNDYKKPKTFHNDLGLLLQMEGISNHSICFSGENTPQYQQLDFPFTMEQNPSDYKNTTFVPKSPLKINGVGKDESLYGKGIVVNGEFDITIGNQWTWRDKTEKLIPQFEGELGNTFMWTIWFSNNKDLIEFKKKYNSSEPFYVNVELSPIYKMNSFEDVEYYCELNFKGYDKRDTLDEFYKKLSQSYKEVV